jgi:hypothetical protein
MNHAPAIGIAETRQRLLDAVDAIADVLVAQTPVDEARGTLSAETVKTLEDAGMFRL